MNKIIIAIIVILVVVLGAYLLLPKKAVQQPLSNSQESNQQLPEATNEEPQLPDNQENPLDNQQIINQQTPQDEVSETPQAKENIVIYTDQGYSPNNIKIKKGEIVVFKNQSSKSMWPASAMHPTHRVYSGTSLEEHCPDITGTAFDACKGFLPGESWSFKFDKTGSWKYHDHLNPSATGTITVE